MTYKSIEIYYDIGKIPGIAATDEKTGFPRPEEIGLALDFRNNAMELIEEALMEAGAGEWEGAEIGMGEVNFGFTVDDFERAEAIVRKAVEGTEFAGIREIARTESAMTGTG
ncbi:MAG: hypothetical protein CSA74_05945 [Rhodobacterales bacterium]|nr:MAG: hypothetical protein CSA74_05945 [Rhodobacterales bacterium]